MNPCADPNIAFLTKDMLDMLLYIVVAGIFLRYLERGK